MKNNIMRCAALITLVMLTITVKAQDDKVWSFGPEIGVNFSKYGRDQSNTNMKAGILGGLFATYSVNKAYGFTGKVLFSQKGAKESTASATSRETLNYIEVPIIGRYFIVKEGSFRPNIFLGPSFGFLTGVYEKTGNSDAEKLDNYKAYVSTFDLGITGGLGFNYEIARDTRIIVDARYTYGLNDISKSTSNVNNMAIGLTAGVAFGIK